MRQGTPLAACPIQVQNGIDHFADVGCSWVSTWLGGWDQRFEDGPFLLGQITGVAESIHFSTSSTFPFFFCFIIPLYTQPLSRVEGFHPIQIVFMHAATECPSLLARCALCFEWGGGRIPVHRKDQVCTPGADRSDLVVLTLP